MDDVVLYNDLDVTRELYDVKAAIPFVVGVNGGNVLFRETCRRHYYFWFFGYVAKLPYECDADDGSRVSVGSRKDGKPWSGVE